MKNKLQSMTCNICGSQSNYIFSKKILHKYNVKYYECPNCRLIQTEKPYWLKEAYASAIALADTGIVQRNILFSRKATSLIYFLSKSDKKFLDYAGGYGLMTRMMRDIGFDYYWDDIYAENIFAKPYAAKNEKYDVVTAFEVLEHLEDPISELEMIDNKYQPNAIIASTLLYKKTVDKNWWYLTPVTGQHISIYKRETLEYIAEKIGYNLYSFEKGIHLFSKKKINPVKFYLVSLFSLPLSLWAQLRMKSLTFTDHQDIIKQ